MRPPRAPCIILGDSEAVFRRYSLEMKIFVKVKPGAKTARVEKSKNGENTFVVWVKPPAKNGRANAALTKILAEHFGIALSSVKILSGLTARRKIIDIASLRQSPADCGAPVLTG